MKLNLGCDTCYLNHKGWTDIDLQPHAPHVVKADALHLPYKNSSADFVFTSHLIEHMPYADGLLLLAECRRVLKPGGRIRVTTPDLAFLADLITGTGMQAFDYLKFQQQSSPKEIPKPRASFVVNRFVRAWGHLFIYDQLTLMDAMLETGFKTITSHKVGESGCEELRDLEPIERLPPGMFQLESLTLEGRK